MINIKLAKSKGFSNETIKKIQILQNQAEDKVQELSELEDKETIIKKFNEWTLINYKLQKLWGWKLDHTMHKGYLLPHCSCPVMDNNDYGSHQIISLDCILHNQ